MADNRLAAVTSGSANEPENLLPPSPITRAWNISDASLLDEIDEIIIRRLTDAEEEGLTRAQLQHRAEYYGRMYDLVYAKLAGDDAAITSESATFAEQAYEFLAEGFWEKNRSRLRSQFRISTKKAPKK